MKIRVNTNRSRVIGTDCNTASETVEANTEIHTWAGTATLPDNVAAGYWIRFTSECIVPYLGGDRTYPAGSVAFSLAANDGAALNWYAVAQG